MFSTTFCRDWQNSYFQKNIVTVSMLSSSKYNLLHVVLTKTFLVRIHNKGNLVIGFLWLKMCFSRPPRTSEFQQTTEFFLVALISLCPETMPTATLKETFAWKSVSLHFRSRPNSVTFLIRLQAVFVCWNGCKIILLF